MKKEITKETLNLLSDLVNKIMVKNNNILVIKEYKTVVETITPRKTIFNRHPKPVDKLFLTSITMIAYNNKLNAIDVVTEDYAFNVINDDDIYLYRGTWLSLYEQIKAFGFELCLTVHNQ